MQSPFAVALCLAEIGAFGCASSISKKNPFGHCVFPTSVAPLVLRRDAWSLVVDVSTSAVDRQHARHVNADQILRALGVQTPPQDVPVLLLPLPIVYLVEQRKWNFLMLLTSWHFAPTRGHSRRPLDPASDHGPVASWPQPTSPV